MAVTRDDIKLIKLREAFAIMVKPPPEIGAWLYVADRSPERNLDSDCFFDNGPAETENPIDCDLEYSVRGRIFAPSLDIDSIQDCVLWADRLAGRPDDAARLEIYDYYCRFDAFPEQLGAPDPPSLTTEEWTRKSDSEWCEKLGAEDKARPCKREGCDRGSIPFSAFCRPHHFETLMKRPYPFDH